MVMSVFDHHVRAGVQRFTNDAVVERVIPARIDADVELRGPQRLRELLEAAPMSIDESFPRLVGRPARAREIRRVVADEELEMDGLVPREPGGALDRRMSRRGGVDDDENDTFLLRHGTPHVARCSTFILRSPQRRCSLNCLVAFGNYVWLERRRLPRNTQRWSPRSSKRCSTPQSTQSSSSTSAGKSSPSIAPPSECSAMRPPTWSVRTSTC